MALGIAVAANGKYIYRVKKFRVLGLGKVVAA